MKPVITFLLILIVCTAAAAQQEKGVDQSNDRIRDSGNNRQAGVNGSKRDTGVGRGIDFGKGKTPTPPPVANPYRFERPNDVLTKAAENRAIQGRRLGTVLRTARAEDAGERRFAGGSLTESETYQR